MTTETPAVTVINHSDHASEHMFDAIDNLTRALRASREQSAAISQSFIEANVRPGQDEDAKLQNELNSLRGNYARQRETIRELTAEQRLDRARIREMSDEIAKRKAWAHEADHLERTIETIKQTGGSVEIRGVRITPCDDHGRPLEVQPMPAGTPPTINPEYVKAIEADRDDYAEINKQLREATADVIQERDGLIAKLAEQGEQHAAELAKWREASARWRKAREDNRHEISELQGCLLDAREQNAKAQTKLTMQAESQEQSAVQWRKAIDSYKERAQKAEAAALEATQALELAQLDNAELREANARASLASVDKSRHPIGLTVRRQNGRDLTTSLRMSLEQHGTASAILRTLERADIIDTFDIDNHPSDTTTKEN
jgi:chromosome segregation ATPase